MRRTLASAFAAPLILLAACGGSDDGPSVAEATTPEAASVTEEPTTEEPTTEEATIEEETSEEPTTEEPTTEEATTEEETGAAGGNGGADGEAAATVTEDFMTALSTADPELCQLILNFNNDGPMTDSPDEVELCESLVVPTLEGLMTEEEIAIIDLIEIDGAQIDGDKATVTGDNMNELFAEGFGEDSIVLYKHDGDWFVSLDESFSGS
ncbi:hypothetical protein [Ornithinimicrobium sp. INDO-MA30-4]|uniref:hypothetical protein n=1 Tax=Ornithinimicrobium sp. INDO-MA30-4 TaxID=2908651 RepID=UPI001F21E4DC|nr:hypothetical protein [Ornithinimicrobium sp. INDO-MA30-4]UJH70523.1 hypothetical protein L0A91_15910 [Ornithinimicrobium sp. INDO-MA30-4]